MSKCPKSNVWKHMATSHTQAFSLSQAVRVHNNKSNSVLVFEWWHNASSCIILLDAHNNALRNAAQGMEFYSPYSAETKT